MIRSARTPQSTTFPERLREPLSHHAMLRWAEPFVRAGWRIDLGASDRSACRIAMAPGAPPGGTAERLELQVLHGGVARLSRRSRRPDGLEASLTIDGGTPAQLLSRLQQLDATPLWHPGNDTGDGFAVAYRLQAACAGHAAAPAPPDLVCATAAVGPFRLQWSEPGRKERSARVSLDGPARELAALPADLFAVLGSSWSLLHEAAADGQRHASVRVHANAPSRLSVVRAAAHLARALAEGPQRFHERLRWRRFGVVAQRALPWLAADLCIVEAGLALPLQPLLSAPVLAAMAAAPLLMLAAWLRWTEDPRLDLPPWPRRVAAHPARAQRW